jgi:hypothetical protein
MAQTAKEMEEEEEYPASINERLVREDDRW